MKKSVMTFSLTMPTKTERQTAQLSQLRTRESTRQVSEIWSWSKKSSKLLLTAVLSTLLMSNSAASHKPFSAPTFYARQCQEWVKLRYLFWRSSRTLTPIRSQPAQSFSATQENWPTKLRTKSSASQNSSKTSALKLCMEVSLSTTIKSYLKVRTLHTLLLGRQAVFCSSQARRQSLWITWRCLFWTSVTDYCRTKVSKAHTSKLL